MTKKDGQGETFSKSLHYIITGTPKEQSQYCNFNLKS